MVALREACCTAWRDLEMRFFPCTLEDGPFAKHIVTHGVICESTFPCIINIVAP